MQQILSRQCFHCRRCSLVGILIIIGFSVIILAIMITFILLSHDSEHDINRTVNNETTKDDGVYQTSTDVSTTDLSTHMISFIHDKEIYISTTVPQNQWILDSSLTIKRAGFPAIAIPNGEILVCGGIGRYDSTFGPFSSYFAPVPFCEIYSSVNRKWRKVSNMNVVRFGLTLTLLSDNKNILAIGSDDDIDGHTAEIYNIYMDKWFFVPNIMNEQRIHHTATLLRNGEVLIVGGILAHNMPVASSNQLYNSLSHTFVTTGSLNIARYGHTAILLDDGLSMLVIGGHDSYGSLLPIRPEIYKEGSWSYTVGDMITTRIDCAAVLLPDGNVLIAGGVNSSSTTVSSVEIYNSITETFSLAQPMACARSHFTLTLLPTGQVLAVGGNYLSGDECIVVTELYNPKTNQWTSTLLLNFFRYDHNSILLNDSVLIIGISNAHYEDVLICERYDL
ncbi:hypothetical protein I4U23_011235 [Adineta vaga]|nr:hypothetical protein I4U23_011235 [Adineta vaga]